MGWSLRLQNLGRLHIGAALFRTTYTMTDRKARTTAGSDRSTTDRGTHGTVYSYAVLGVMILTALCLTFIVFFLTNLYPNLEKLAKTQGNFRMSDERLQRWLDNRAIDTPPYEIRRMAWALCPAMSLKAQTVKPRTMALRQGQSSKTRRICGVFKGDWGYSSVFKETCPTSLRRGCPDRQV